MGSASQQYCLRWNNHRTNLLSVFEELLQNEAFTDVTLAVEGGASIKCHKMVLAACSSYFQHLFIDLPCRHPIVVLKDVKYSEMKAILEYMYRGEVNVGQDQLDGLLRVAEVLKVKGLVEEKGSQTKPSSDETDGDRRSSPLPSVGTSTAATGREDVAADDRPRPASTHSLDNGHAYGAIYGEAAIDANQSRLSLPIWALSGLAIPQHPAGLDHRASLLAAAAAVAASSSSASSASTVAVSPANGYDGTVSKRKRYDLARQEVDRDTPILRTVLGAHGQVDHEARELHQDERRHSSRANGPTKERDRADQPIHGHYADAMNAPEDADGKPTARDGKSGASSAVPGQKPNWKRYKQYTREDMMAAIEAVRSGMSTPKASRKYGVPSRTLYEKVNSLGITTSRPFKRAANSNSGSACFPYGIGGNVNGGIYGNRLSESESENSCATVENNPGAETIATDGRREIGGGGGGERSQRNNGDHVEDLSIKSKAETTIRVPGIVVKEERQDVATSDV